MSDTLPENWAQARLKDLLLPTETINPASERKGHIRYIDIESVDNKRQEISNAKSIPAQEAPSRARRKVHQGDVIFSLVRPYLKNLAIIPQELDGEVASTAFFVSRLGGGVRSEWLYQHLRRDKVINDLPTVGNSPPATRDVDFEEHSVPVAPTNEQTRILSILEPTLAKIDEAEEALERVRRNLDRYRASVLKAACEGRLVPTEAELARQQGRDYEPASQLLERILVARREAWEKAQLEAYAQKGNAPPKDWKSRHPEPQTPDTSDLPELPEGWCWATIHQVGETQLGRQRAPQHQSGDHMRPYLRVANVFEDRIDDSNVYSMNFTPAEFERYELKPGDILLNEGQSPELVGRPAIYRGGIDQCCYQKTLLRFRNYPGVRTEFALATFRKNMRCGRFRRAAKITTSIAHLTQETFIVIEFALPPEPEQQRIVVEVERRLSCINALDRQVAAGLKRCNILRQSLLKHAFSGKLVPQDPADEPTSELLERIRAQRRELEGGSAPRKRAVRKTKKSS